MDTIWPGKSRGTSKLKRYLEPRLVVITLVLFSMALLAQFPELHWTLDLLTSFTLYYYLAGLLLTFLFLIIRKPVWAVLPLALSGYHYTLLDPYSGAGATSCLVEKSGEELAILQFNVGSRNDQIGAISSWINTQESPPDIIIFFEATERLDSILKEMKIGAWPHVLSRFQTDNFGIAAASRMGDAELALATIGDPYYPSLVIERTSSREGLPFALIATHPPPPLTGELSSARNQQFKALAKKLNTFRMPNRILLGDLNVTPWSPRFGQLLNESGTRDAQAGRGYAGTYPAYGIPKFLALPIDHTLVSPNIKVLSRLVWSGSDFGSDHNLVLTRLWLSDCEKPI